MKHVIAYELYEMSVDTVEVYRGTTVPFAGWDINKTGEYNSWGRGFYFTSDYGTAKRYAGRRGHVTVLEVPESAIDMCLNLDSDARPEVMNAVIAFIKQAKDVDVSERKVAIAKIKRARKAIEMFTSIPDPLVRDGEKFRALMKHLRDATGVTGIVFPNTFLQDRRDAEGYTYVFTDPEELEQWRYKE